MDEEQLLDRMARMTPYICEGWGQDHFRGKLIVVYGEDLPIEHNKSCLLPFYLRYGGGFYDEPAKNKVCWQCPTYITNHLLLKLAPYFEKYKMHVHIRVANKILNGKD